MLVELKLSEIASICNGSLLGEDRLVYSVKTDTRLSLQGSLYLAIKGDSFDGHAYLETALKNGALAVLSQQDSQVRPLVLVDDTRQAYADIAHYLRQLFSGKLVAITGSNGKTTIKEWLSQCLAERVKVLKTEKNNNNQIGVPLTLLGLKKEHQVAVIETGTSFVGEIAKLAQITTPDIAIISNASGSHYEGFGSIEGIAKEKGALLTGLTAEGVAILNHDDPWFDYWVGLLDKRACVSFGFGSGADLVAKQVELFSQSSKSILCYQGEEYVLHLAVPGKHQVANAMAVLLALLNLGVTFESACESLSRPLVIDKRLEFQYLNSQALVLNDCYNASPKSVEAAIDVLMSQSQGQKWLVLGALGELGELEEKIHQQLGEYAAFAGVTGLISVGPIAAIAAKAYEERGGVAVYCENNLQAAEFIKPLGKENAILVKGSRSAQMEQIIKVLEN
ncbi:UDP-N-acetylmuramoylalanyl-D-glutamyl-2,6-diaminopimelate-D-alanyl-D-alanyl ligase [Marinomonas sp. MED121]|uniref:UDP-N-acetylmuramoyl-tripeptide--D-alanyl-D- alanine ligase n=1 Tax=Marinomonas sp. MED121 TaxID=314277 RepID=UPI0000690524|nr:UDP-N-acetylmuramoyl-tripeptide--D-alanyl-D-alanine ligase [Marinomonas sp. MED121]EAQ63377.1 UDP-N-acetylmuramoylalanyl-D-glutamyl-2,6-diaminopimelate-D-alanyl-D-alanyl ligase [Marinomonas sp. MED121]